MRFNEKVWQKCRLIPKGKVSTYKEIAKSLKTKAYRTIGNALKKNPYAPKVPCHRVVNSDGSLGGYKGRLNSMEKIRLLRKEGIKITNGKIIDFRKKIYEF